VVRVMTEAANTRKYLAMAARQILASTIIMGMT
jgi:hypothetical protein